MEFISKGGVKISDIREMNPLVFSWVFSALEEEVACFHLSLLLDSPEESKYWIRLHSLTWKAKGLLHWNFSAEAVG